jgi:hypothetical protein
MSTRFPEPPSGQAPPVRVELPSGEALDLALLAAEVCARYEAEYPDEQQRYGEAGHLWCLHDNQHLLNWAAWELGEHVVLREQVAWLAGVLAARDYPLDRLARDLDICAEVVSAQVDGGAEMAALLADAAVSVRERG